MIYLFQAPPLAESLPGNHPLTPVCGDQSFSIVIGKFFYCGFTLDTLVSSALAIAVTLAIGFLIANRVSHGVPGKLQMVLEFLLDYAKGMIRDTVADDAEFIIPIAATIFLYILVANWLDFFPLPHPLFHPANQDINQTFAMAIVVILVVQWYSVRVLGWGGYLRRFTKPFDGNLFMRIAFVPLNIIEEVTKPISLALRLFGNIFAGGLMVYLLTLLPIWISPAPLILWKAFDVFFVGTIQAFIFMLLTIIYFHMAREGLEEEHGHGGHSAVATKPTGQGAAEAVPSTTH